MENKPKNSTVVVPIWAIFTTIGVGVLLLVFMGVILVIVAGNSNNNLPVSTQAHQRPAALPTATIQPTVAVMTTVTPTAMLQATTTPEPAQKALIVKGSPGQLKDWSVTVTDETNFGSALTRSNYGNKTLASGNWIVLKLAIKNNGKSTSSVGLENFNIGLTDGTVFTADLPGSAYSEFMGGKRITDPVPPGVTMTTYAAFDTQPGLRDLIMLFIFDRNNVRFFDASL